jgi:hypothetical protein
MNNHLVSSVMGGGGWILHLVFYRIPKNASTSMMNHLGHLNLIKKHEDKFHKLANQKIYRKFFDPTHAKPDEAYEILGQQLRNYFSFCIVRNPWDRVVSMYHFTKKHNIYQIYGYEQDMTFEEFCENLLERKDDDSFLPTHKQVEWTKGIYPPKEILKFENLKQDFAKMLQDYNIGHISPNIPHDNSTNHKNYTEIYTPKTKKIVANIFEEDVDVFKYTFD